MNIAIDHDAIAKAIYHGLVTASPIHVPISGWKDLEPIPYDPEKAKKLLADAGYSDGFKFTMTSNTMSPGMEMPKIVEAVASYWVKIGLKPKIEQGTYSGFRPKFASGKTAEMIWVMRTRLGRELSKQMLMFNYPNGSISWYQDKELKSLLDKLKTEFEPTKRNAIWREIAHYCRNNWVSVPIAYAPTVYGCSKRVGDWPLNLFSSSPNYISYIRHKNPLNTWRLFEIK
jgi:peptide/nickel transport system substrate-binding protein